MQEIISDREHFPIFIGSDHAGFQVKEILINYLKEKDYQIIDMGCYSEDRVDYPDVAKSVGEKLLEFLPDNPLSRGILICGSGIGVQISSNRMNGIRASVLWNTEAAKLFREHNNGNIACFGARLQTIPVIQACLDIFLHTGFEGGRHYERICKIDS